MSKLDLKPNQIVVIRAFDDVPEHRFRVTDVWPGTIGGVALEGPLKGTYGEPCFGQIKEIAK